MAWRVAESLDVLLAELNAAFPNRSKESDGSIGDIRHQHEKSSDHNPWVMDRGEGVVTARDFTNDPAHGLDSEKLAEALRAAKDGRLKYVISNRKIFAGGEGPSPWQWRPYGGSNPHNHHVHVSVRSDVRLCDDTRAWDLSALDVDAKAVAAPAASPTAKNLRPTLRLGDKDKGQSGPVRDLQKALGAKGGNLKVDGDFGAKTEIAVKAFQTNAKILADGIVGPYTWEKLADSLTDSRGASIKEELPATEAAVAAKT